MTITVQRVAMGFQVRLRSRRSESFRRALAQFQTSIPKAQRRYQDRYWFVALRGERHLRGWAELMEREQKARVTWSEEREAERRARAVTEMAVEAGMSEAKILEAE